LTLDQSLFGAFTAGLLSFLSPCVLPLVPPYLCFLTGADIGQLTRSESSGLARRSVWRAMWFVAGFATVFVLLGATASAIGQTLSEWFDRLAIVAGLLVILLGLNFLGVLRIGLLLREGRFQTATGPASAAGAYGVGLAFAFGWTPCVGPVLAAILMIAGAGETASRGMFLLLAYSAGIGVPFVLAAIFVKPFLGFLSRFRCHVAVVEKVMGAALVATGVLILTGGMSVVGDWLLNMFPILGRIG
jgi:cytochrome c-type biogenesis protein